MRTIQYICKGFSKIINFCLSFSCKWKIIQSKFGFSVRGEQKLCYFLESIKLILKQYLKVCGEMMIQISVKHCMYILELNLISLWNEHFKL